MPPIELGPMRPVGATDSRLNRSVGGVSARPAKEEKSVAAVSLSEALDAGETAPVDAERVEVIRRAIETDTYPVLPFKVADAMIAAGLLLRVSK